jgi:hypothetical protein
MAWASCAATMYRSVRISSAIRAASAARVIA